MSDKRTGESVWPVIDYTGKIEMAVRSTLKRTAWLTYTQDQLTQVVKKGYEWLQNNTPKQDENLGMIVRLTCRSLIYQGLVVKVKVKTNTTITWQWKAGAEDPDSGATILTSDTTAVKSEKAKKLLREKGPINPLKLRQMLLAA